MPSLTLDVSAVYPEGTSLGAYEVRTQSSQDSAPLGDPVDTDTVSAGEVTFDNLTEDETYLAVGQVSGAWVKYGFTVNLSPPGVLVNGVELATQEALDAEVSTRASADSSLDTRTDATEADIAVLNEFINVKNYGCVGDGTTDDTTAWNAALTAAENATGNGGKVVAPPGTYLLDDEINFDQFVAFEGAGERECILKLNDAGSYLHFNEPGGSTNSRGGAVSGFHVDGNNVATTCMWLHKSVNRTFEKFRVSRPGASGIALLSDAAQNCNVEQFDIEATNALTVGIKITDSSGSMRFKGLSIVGGDYAGIWVTQDNAGGQEGIGYPEPRFIHIEDAIVEHGDPTTACALRVHSARDLNVNNSQLLVGTDVASSGPYTIIEINDSGEGTTDQINFDNVHVSGGADPIKDSTAFLISGGSDCRVRVNTVNLGNNNIGVNADSGQTVEFMSYRGPSVTTMFTGAGTIRRRAIGDTLIYPPAGTKALTAAGSITGVEYEHTYYPVSGNTTINSLNATYAGHQIALKFSGTPTVSSSAGNIKLSGLVDMSATADDMLCLLCDGTDWHETSRVVK